MRVFPNGLGEILGDTVVINKPYQSTANTWFVNSATGTDAGGTAGQDREKPLATLGQAITNAAALDTIVLEAGHAETLTNFLAVNKQLVIAGGGSSGGIPTVTFTMNAVAADTLSMSVANSEIRNIRFLQSSQTNAGSGGAKVRVSASGCRIIGCYFDMGANDNYAGILLDTGASNSRVESTTIISTAPTSATRPATGLSVNTAALSDIELYNVILSDGPFGFQNAALLASAQIVTRFRAVNLSLLLGASMLMNASSTGWISGLTQTGGGKVVW